MSRLLQIVWMAIGGILFFATFTFLVKGVQGVIFLRVWTTYGKPPFSGQLLLGDEAARFGSTNLGASIICGAVFFICWGRIKHCVEEFWASF